MAIRLFLIIVTFLSTWSYAQAAQTTETFVISDFETGDIPVVRPSYAIDAYQRYLWSHYPIDNAGNQRPGWAEISSEDSYEGSRSLKATIDSAMNIFVQYYPYDESKYEWFYIKEQENKNNPSKVWKNDTYNRIRLWVKAPPTLQKEDVKRFNAHFGTYVRGLTGSRSNAESGGGDHFYHYYNIGYSGEWHQVIVDFHPNHRRGASGGQEQGVREYPTGEEGFNYFDLMTRFYFTFKNNLTAYPGSFYIDNVELYRDPNPENIDQIYALHGVYVNSSNTITVGWSRDKTENDVRHQVRYAFSDVHDSGWDSALVAPGNSTISPPGWEGYNGMEYSTSAIDVGNNAFIYIAIKPENSNLFRQIRIPLNAEAKSLALPPSSFTGSVVQ